MTSSSNTKLYFAYGSNLDAQDWERWCQENNCDQNALRSVSPAYAPDHALVFNYRSRTRNGGVLNLKQCLGAVTSGWLFEASASGWKVLDAKEGHPHCYQRLNIDVINDQGQHVIAQTYIVADKRNIAYVKPAPRYLEICRRGREARGLDTAGLDAAAKDEAVELCDNLFVYGTLMRGESRFGALAKHGIECALLAKVPGQLLDHRLYPGLALDKKGWVYGEFLKIRDIDPALRDSDVIEGFVGFNAPQSSLFRRTLIDVDVGDGRVRRAWAYITCETGSRITSGCWRTHRGKRDVALETIVARHADSNPHFFEGLRDLASSAWGGIGVDRCAVFNIETVAALLRDDKISERKLAGVSGNWAVI